MRCMLTICLSIFLLLGCSKDITSTDLDPRLLEDAIHLIQENENGVLPLTGLPQSIEKLEPMSLRIESSGLYIILWRRFTDEGGVFIPKDNGMAFDSSTNPGYRMVRKDVYFYNLKG